MYFQTQTMTCAVTEIVSIAMASNNIPGQCIRFTACHARLNMFECVKLRLKHNIVDLTQLRR
ncbi:hypothetical protein D3C78_1945420 [compost metagenome]